MYPWISWELVADAKGCMEHTPENSALINKITVKHNILLITSYMLRCTC
jgi:hypothetical protein